MNIVKAFSSPAYPYISMPIIWGLAAFFYFYENLLQVLPAVIKPELTQAFNLSGAEYGQLTAMCFYTYGLMQIPVGIWVDRFKTKYMLSFSCLLCAIGCFIFALSKTFMLAKMGRILMGMGGSFAFICTTKLATHYFPLRWTAFLLGITVTLGFLGSVVGLAWINTLMEVFNWRNVILGLSLIGVILSLILFVFVPSDRIFFHASFLKVQQQKKMSIIFKKKSVWIAAFYGCFMFIPTQIFGASWGVPFLCEAHGFERDVAGFCTAFIYAGWIVGAPLWGWLSSRYHIDYLILNAATVITLVLCLIIILSDSLSTYLVGSVLFGLGLFSSAYLLIFSMIQSMIPIQFSGTVFGILNAVSSLSAFVDPLVGKILDQFFLGRKIGKYLYHLSDYQSVLWVVPICLLIALFLITLFKSLFLKSRCLNTLKPGNKRSDFKNFNPGLM